MPSSGVKTCADRKSTRLNSSHTIISYAVFCLKKKNVRNRHRTAQPYTSPPEHRAHLATHGRAGRLYHGEDDRPRVRGFGEGRALFFFKHTAPTEIRSAALQVPLLI